MIRILLCTFIFSSTCFIAHADMLATKSLICGGTKITASPAKMRGGAQVLNDFSINIERVNTLRSFSFSASNDFLHARCEVGKNGEPMLLINHYCGGSGCSESNFSIINLNTLQVLLNANERWKGNHALAESVIGKEIKPISCTNSKEELCLSAIYD